MDSEFENIDVEVENNNIKKKNNKNIIFVVIMFVVGIFCVFSGTYYFKNKPVSNVETPSSEKKSPYRLSGNGLENFDLYFLKLENEEKNKVYSPLSIKYAMQMLSEGASGETKQQLDNVIGDYEVKKYTNSKNMSFANALFVKDSYKNNIKDSYIQNLSTKYNAEIVYDSFKNSKNINNWINQKTLSLIKDAIKDEQLENTKFLITNALAIDMNWNNVIQAPDRTYSVEYSHEKFDGLYIGPLSLGYYDLEFNNKTLNVNAASIGAVVNKYDIVKALGEDKIRELVGAEYKKWLATEDSKYYTTIESEYYPTDVNKYLDKYISELNSNYKEVSSSTDFSFYDDENIKAFAKDLKTYDGTTLQYVGIMPKSTTLTNYINETDAFKLNNVISDLKDIKLENFDEGYITRITGHIPMYKFDYSLNLIEDMKSLGITNVFDSNKSDLSNISNEKNTFITEAIHKANIEFANEGIKASAVTFFGGDGNAINNGFDYLFDVPVKEIDLTFDKPYLFLIRDKNSGEVWFTGTVYNPTEYINID